MIRPPPRSSLFPYPTLFRSQFTTKVFRTQPHDAPHCRRLFNWRYFRLSVGVLAAHHAATWLISAFKAVHMDPGRPHDICHIQVVTISTGGELRAAAPCYWRWKHAGCGIAASYQTVRSD